MSVVLSGVTLPVVALLMGLKTIQSRPYQCGGAADWWWGDERLPTLDGESTPNNL